MRICQYGVRTPLGKEAVSLGGGQVQAWIQEFQTDARVYFSRTGMYNVSPNMPLSKNASVYNPKAIA